MSEVSEQLQCVSFYPRALQLYKNPTFSTIHYWRLHVNHSCDKTAGGSGIMKESHRSTHVLWSKSAEWEACDSLDLCGLTKKTTSASYESGELFQAPWFLRNADQIIMNRVSITGGAWGRTNRNGPDGKCLLEISVEERSQFAN